MNLKAIADELIGTQASLEGVSSTYDDLEAELKAAGLCVRCEGCSMWLDPETIDVTGYCNVCNDIFDDNDFDPEEEVNDEEPGDYNWDAEEDEDDFEEEEPGWDGDDWLDF